jgi:hypothetical protein
MNRTTSLDPRFISVRNPRRLNGKQDQRHGEHPMPHRATPSTVVFGDFLFER